MGLNPIVTLQRITNESSTKGGAMSDTKQHANIQEEVNKRIREGNHIADRITLRDQLAMATFPVISAVMKYDPAISVQNYIDSCWQRSYQCADAAMLAARSGKNSNLTNERE